MSDISQAAAYRVCSKFSPTLLIDEINWDSAGTMNKFRQLLRAGSGHSSRALRVGESSTSFGPKVFGSLEASSDPALNSRCIQIVMAETTNSGLLKPGDPSVMQSASDLRQQLLRFRFNSYNAISPALVRDAEQLRPRSRDILRSLAAPLVKSRLYTRLLFDFIIANHDPVTRESLDPRQEALNAAIWWFSHAKNPRFNVRIGGDIGLTWCTNNFLKCERLSVTEKAVGGMLASMGYRNKHRTNVGWILRLDSSTVARCHQLLKAYDNKYVQIAFTKFSIACPFCRTLATPKKT